MICKCNTILIKYYEYLSSLFNNSLWVHFNFINCSFFEFDDVETAVSCACSQNCENCAHYVAGFLKFFLLFREFFFAENGSNLYLNRQKVELKRKTHIATHFFSSATFCLLTMILSGVDTERFTANFPPNQIVRSFTPFRAMMY